jgi:hypothetical protein
MKNLFVSISAVLITVLSALVLVSTAPLYAAAPKAPKDAVCEGAGLVGSGAGGCTTAAGSKSIGNIVSIAVNLFSAIIGIIAVVMIMVGGVKYITSQGEPAQTAAAKNTVLYAAIGIVVVVLSQVIVRYVLNKFTGI